MLLSIKKRRNYLLPWECAHMSLDFNHDHHFMEYKSLIGYAFGDMGWMVRFVGIWNEWLGCRGHKMIDLQSMAFYKVLLLMILAHLIDINVF